MRKRRPIQAYIDGVLAGDRVLLSQAITLVESRLDSDQELAEKVLEGCMPHTGNSFRIGITGVPGVGKSTFIDAFGLHLIDQGKKLAVLAVDPSSQRTRGSILGDKTRMGRLALDKRAYIRPSPARETLGGVTRSTRETILLCEAAGFDTIIVETVGVGQSEIAVHSMVDFFLLLMLAGAGDELQGIKKGIVEMADGMVINKADGENLLPAKKARTEYQKALHLLAPNRNAWIPKVLTCSSIEGAGLEGIRELLETFRKKMELSGDWESNRKRQAREWMKDTIVNLLEDRFFKNDRVKNELPNLDAQVISGKIAPTSAAKSLIRLYLQGL